MVTGTRLLASRRIIRGMNLSADDTAALAGLLRDMIAADRFPLSPRIKHWRAILDKLDPPAPAPKPAPVSPLNPPAAPRVVSIKEWRR